MRAIYRNTFWLLLCLPLAGCVSSHQRTLSRLIDEDGGDRNLSHIESVVLPPRGEPAYVLLYATGVHASRVQVASFRKGKPTVLFAGGSNTPDTDFRMEYGVPTIILEQADYQPDYATGKRSREFYAWNGTTFTLTKTEAVSQCEKDGYVMDCS